MTGIGHSDERGQTGGGIRAVRAAWLTALALVAATATCSTAGAASIGIGAKVLDNPDALVSKGLYQSVGQHPKSVSCPANVPAKVGHVFKCKIVVNANGQYVIATVTETSLSGSTVHINISDGTKLYSPK